MQRWLDAQRKHAHGMHRFTPEDFRLGSERFMC
jgi:hypothetical protein